MAAMLVRCAAMVAAAVAAGTAGARAERCEDAAAARGWTRAEQEALCASTRDGDWETAMACGLDLKAWLGPAQAAALCGSSSAAPAVRACAEELRFTWTHAQVAQMCAAARSDAPQRCAKAMLELGQPPTRAAWLCETGPEHAADAGGDGLRVVQCFRRALAMPGWDADSAASLCRWRDSVEPAQCAAAAVHNPLFATPDAAVALCAGNASPFAGECAALCPRGASSDTELSACIATCRLAERAQAGSCVASALRSNALRKRFETTAAPETLITRLCRAADSDLPVRCALKASVPNAANPAEAAADLCEGILEGEPLSERLRCAQTAPKQLGPSARVALCNGTTILDRGNAHSSTARLSGPAQCAQALLRQRFPLSEALVLELCRADGSYSRSDAHGLERAQCMRFIKALASQEANEPFVRAGIAICRAHHDYSGPVESRHERMRCIEEASAVIRAATERPGQEELRSGLVHLCRHAQDRAPTVCFSSAMRLLSGDLAQAWSLCSASRERPQQVLAASCCLKRLDSVLGRKAFAAVAAQGGAAALCRDALPESCGSPAECIAALQRTSRSAPFDHDEQIALCAGAASPYPGWCALELWRDAQRLGLSTPALVQLCRSQRETKGRLSNPVQCWRAARAAFRGSQLDAAVVDGLLKLCTDAGPEAGQCLAERGRNVNWAVLSACKTSRDVNHTLSCLAEAPAALPAAARERLCEAAPLEGPVECAAALDEAHYDAVGACQGASDTAPAQCVADALGSHAVARSHFLDVLTPGQAAGLCHGSNLETERVACLDLMAGLQANKAELLGLTKLDALGLCAAAKQPTAAAECVLGASRRSASFSLAQVLALCERAEAADPGLCAAIPAAAALSADQAVTLCAGARAGQARAPHRCLTQAVTLEHFQDDLDAAVRLCAGSGDHPDGPIKCAREADYALQVAAAAEIAALCAGAASEAPVRCVLGLPGNRLQTRDKVQICRGEGAAAPAVAECLREAGNQFSEWEAQLLLPLCGSAASNSTWTCLRDAPAAWSALEKVELCKSGAGSAAARCAADVLGQTMRAFTVREVVDTCATAHTPMPQTCALFLSSHLVPSELASRQCAGASTEAPHKCLFFTGVKGHGNKWHEVPDAQVEQCRRAVVRPTRLAVDKTPHLYKVFEEGILSETNIGPLALHVLDQFDFRLGPDDMPANLTAVIVSLRERGKLESLPAKTEASPTSAVFIAAADAATLAATFESLVIIDAAGQLELIFRAHGGVHPLEPAVLALAVSRNLDTMMRAILRCSVAPSRLQTPADEAGPSGEYLLPPPWALMAFDRQCEAQLESMGLVVLGGVFLSPSGLRVRVLPGPAKLLSSLGVPRDNMAPEEVLQVGANATATEIRRAYHRASLEWHPDRWVGFHPELQAKAADVFGIVAKANADMLATARASATYCRGGSADESCASV